MASIEYAKDRNSNIVLANEACRGMEYICPYCFENVRVRKGSIIMGYFAHESIPDRTPLQRTCPGYTGNEKFPAISNSMSKMYINNGGIPLFLCFENERFELRAYFPKLSDTNMAHLRYVNARILINDEAIYDVDKAVYSIDNLNFYKVDTIQQWISVDCNPNVDLNEMKLKWLWGIRGIDLKRDIYHSNKEGGYRVALKSNIYIGKTYRIIFENYPLSIDGVKFSRLGSIRLKDGYSNTGVFFDVYLMELISFTEEARRFIESKGYNLLDSVNELIPLWPPAVFEGTELIYEDAKAMFLHLNKNSKESVCFIDFKLSEPIEIKNKLSVIDVSTSNKTLLVSEMDRNLIDEIKYNLVRVNSLVKKPQLALTITVMDSENNIFDFTNEQIKPPKDGKIVVHSNMPFKAIVSAGNYVTYSSCTCFENVRSFDDLNLNSMAFGVMIHRYKCDTSTKTDKEDFNYEKAYKYLYRCISPCVNADTRIIELLYLLSKNINYENIELYRLIESWVKGNSVPLMALWYLRNMRISIGGLANGKNN